MTCGHKTEGMCDVKADCGYIICCKECAHRDYCDSKCEMPEEM